MPITMMMKERKRLLTSPHPIFIRQSRGHNCAPTRGWRGPTLSRSMMTWEKQPISSSCGIITMASVTTLEEDEAATNLVLLQEKEMLMRRFKPNPAYYDRARAP
mmetsp:Transcript_24321/g.55793  ORF Transcript_24321/g.55793 Transcript_24321/m.55793 type:complete len:104 (+) Transcript_24321:99-410(+)